MTTQTISSKTIRSYNDILSFFYTVGYEYNRKWVPTPDRIENPVGCANFWRLYKKGAKNQDAQHEWNISFGQGGVWKHPTTGEWRFYFNIDQEVRDKREKAIFPETQAEKDDRIIKEDAKKHAEKKLAELDAKEVKVLPLEKVIYEESEQELTEKIEKSELDVREGMNFTAEQLKIIKNLK
jgi:hypothetical protein